MRINPRLNYRITLLFILLLFANCQKDPIERENIESLAPPEGTIPRISINTNGATIVDEPKVNATMEVSSDEATLFEGPIAIEIRGASSQFFPKKSYGFETRDSNNEDLDVALLGFPEEEDWILYGPYSDKSLMRNILIYDLARNMGRYASRSLFAELTINNNYAGVYVFMEKLKRDDVRIAISTLNPNENSGVDLTGGYVLKIDKVSGSNLGSGYNNLNSFTSTYDPPSSNAGQTIKFLYEYPDAEDITDEQKGYISNYVAEFENALASNEFTDPQLGYRSLIDVDSFIDFFILNELSNNVDGYRLSTYMHKDKNEKLKMGPIWDFNLAFGNADYCDGGATNVWAYRFNERCPDDFWLVPFWWGRLLEDPQYVAQLKNRWNSLRSSHLSNQSIMSLVENYEELLNSSNASSNNFNTWDVLGTYIWPNNFVGATYDDEMGYLKQWIQDRLVWLDNAIQEL